MKKIKAYFGLKLVNFGIWFYDINSDQVWDQEDQHNYDRLKKYQADFLKVLQ